jgi:hypothetical protein
MIVEAQAAVSACSQCCQSVATSSANGSSDLVKTIITVIALPLSALTFWLGYRQREFERRRSYYQDVVIDAVLPDILPVFDQQSLDMSNAGTEGLKGLSSVRKTMPRSCSIALATFADSIFRLQDRIVQRVAIFDELQVESIREEFQQLQDDVANWFNDIGLHKRREVGEIDALLRTHQRNLIRMLYRAEMRSFQ